MIITRIDKDRNLHLDLDTDESSVRTLEGETLMVFNSSMHAFVIRDGQRVPVAKLGMDQNSNWAVKEQFTDVLVHVPPEAPHSKNGIEPTFRLEVAYFKAYEAAQQ